MTNPRNLIAVLSNPPLDTSGSRTRARVDQARLALEFDRASIVNLFPLPTYRTGAIAAVGAEAEPWLSARPALLVGLQSADAVILGYGLDEPVGAARVWHRAQVSWLNAELIALGTPTYVVGEGPRHPSRWHRYTSRRYPGQPFEDALLKSLRRFDTETNLGGRFT